MEYTIAERPELRLSKSFVANVEETTSLEHPVSLANFNRSVPAERTPQYIHRVQYSRVSAGITYDEN